MQCNGMAEALSYRDRATIMVLLAVMFASGADMLVMTPTLPQISRELGVSVDLGGLWVTAYAASTGLFALLFGPVSDRYGRKLLLQLGMGAIFLGTIGCGFADGFWAMIVARSFAGAGAGLLVTSTTSFVGDHFGTEHRAVAMGYVMSGFFLSLILAVPIGAFLADSYGWQNMFLVLAAFCVPVGVGVALLPQPKNEKRSAHLTPSIAARNYLELLKERKVWGVVLMSASIGLAMTMFSVYSSPWMEETFALDTRQRGLVYTVGGPAVLLGGPLAGRLSNYFGRVNVVVAGSFLMGFSQMIMPLSAMFTEYLEGRIVAENYQFDLFGNIVWPALLPTFFTFLLVMTAGSSRSAPFQTLILEIVPSEKRGAIAALRNSFNQVASGLGAALGGLYWAKTEQPYVWVCLSAAVITLSGALVLRSLVGKDLPSAKSQP